MEDTIRRIWEKENVVIIGPFDVYFVRKILCKRNDWLVLMWKAIEIIQCVCVCVISFFMT